MLPEEDGDDSFVRKTSVKSFCKPILNNLKSEIGSGLSSSDDAFLNKIKESNFPSITEKYGQNVSINNFNNDKSKNLNICTDFEFRDNEMDDDDDDVTVFSTSDAYLYLPSMDDSIKYSKNQNLWKGFPNGTKKKQSVSFFHKSENVSKKLQSTSRPLMLSKSSSVANVVTTVVPDYNVSLIIDDPELKKKKQNP